MKYIHALCLLLVLVIGFLIGIFSSAAINARSHKRETYVLIEGRIDLGFMFAEVEPGSNLIDTLYGFVVKTGKNHLVQCYVPQKLFHTHKSGDKIKFVCPLERLVPPDSRYEIKSIIH